MQQFWHVCGWVCSSLIWFVCSHGFYLFDRVAYLVEDKTSSRGCVNNQTSPTTCQKMIHSWLQHWNVDIFGPNIAFFALAWISLFPLTLHPAHPVHGIVSAHHHSHLLKVTKGWLIISIDVKTYCWDMRNRWQEVDYSQCQCPCTSSSQRCGWSLHCCTRYPPGTTTVEMV